MTHVTHDNLVFSHITMSLVDAVNLVTQFEQICIKMKKSFRNSLHEILYNLSKIPKGAEAKLTH